MNIKIINKQTTSVVWAFIIEIRHFYVLNFTQSDILNGALQSIERRKKINLIYTLITSMFVFRSLAGYEIIFIENFNVDIYHKYSVPQRTFVNFKQNFHTITVLDVIQGF